MRFHIISTDDMFFGFSSRGDDSSGNPQLLCGQLYKSNLIIDGEAVLSVMNISAGNFKFVIPTVFSTNKCTRGISGTYAATLRRVNQYMKQKFSVENYFRDGRP